MNHESLSQLMTSKSRRQIKTHHSQYFLSTQFFDLKISSMKNITNPRSARTGENNGKVKNNAADESSMWAIQKK